MASLVLNGNTSGSVTISSPAVSGTTTLTLPTTSGTVLTNGTNTNFPAGSVLQVVTGTLNTQFSTASISVTSTGLTASITPSSASNKILAIISVGSFNGNVQNSGPFMTLLRNGTNVVSTGATLNSLAFLQVNLASGGALYMPSSFSFLDSPSTTSAIAYAVGTAAQAGTVLVNTIGLSTITLMEIKG